MTTQPIQLTNRHPLENDPVSQKKYQQLLENLHQSQMDQFRQQFAPPLFSRETARQWIEPKIDAAKLPILSRSPVVERLSPSLQKEIKISGLQLLQRIVEVDSQTQNIEGNAAVRRMVAEELAALGGIVEEHPTARATVIRFTTQNPTSSKFLLVGHTDTVLKRDDFYPPFSRQDGKIRGSGVADMKGGLAVMVSALRTLQQTGELKDKNITVLLNSDEEIGSPHSQPVFEAEAKRHTIGLVYESGKISSSSANSNGAVTVGRKGILSFDIDVVGQTTHSGTSPYAGLNAGRIAGNITALIDSLNDYEKGITANVGVFETNEGTTRNRFIDHVHLKAEIRHWNDSEAEHYRNLVTLMVQGAMECSSLIEEGKILCSNYALTIDSRAPAPVNSESLRLVASARQTAAELGMSLDVLTSGGASDMNLLREMGMAATLDSLGIVGDRIHSPDEFADEETFLPRVELTVQLLKQGGKTL